MTQRAIDEVLDFIKSGNGDNKIKKIKKKKLPEVVLNFVEEYEEACGDRNRFLWKWGIELVSSKKTGFLFSTVPEKKARRAGNLKVILTIFVTSVDDVADKYKDEKLLQKALKVPFEKSETFIKEIKKKKRRKRLKFMSKAWKYLKKKLKKLPRYQEFKKILDYDIEQLINSFYHSFMVNTNPRLINLDEAWVYGSHNMVFFPYSDIDLMASPNFNTKDLSTLRRIIWKAQMMARIGNWLSTWERELKEEDYSSGVFAYAVNKGIIDPMELKDGNKEEILEKIKESKVEEYFLEKWQKKYEEIEELAPRVESVDIDGYLEGLKNGIKFHLVSRGLK